MSFRTFPQECPPGYSSSCLMKPSICPHIQSIIKPAAFRKDLKICVKFSITACLFPSRIPNLVCAFCNSINRLHVCLFCVFVACKDHISFHSKEHSHLLSLDIKFREVLCAPCKDYIYDDDLSSLVRSASLLANHSLYLHSMSSWILQAVKPSFLCSLYQHQETDPSQIPSLDSFSPWKPSEEDTKQITENSKPLDIKDHNFGVRGLVNLGNTCFMNCILQVFIHNPPFRNYFLSDKHNRYSCPRRLQDPSEVCMGCEMDLLFHQSLIGRPDPYTPAHFLYSVWKYSNYFAGYDQQDAHEFLISTLNGIHSHCSAASATPATTTGNQTNCRCVVHSIFSGVLRSDVTCTRCNYTSTIYDPFFDISLNIPKLPVAAVEPDSTPENQPRFSLESCLINFTRAERLDNNEKAQCWKCKYYQEPIKQFSIKILPQVICVHMKRFEQTANCKRTSTKINSIVDFPMELDITPYTCSNILRARAGLPPISCVPEMYELFAVINHHGTMENGHYTCFVRFGDMWLKCDDAWITMASVSTVLSSQGYLLFYIRKNFLYHRLDFQRSTD